MIEKVARVGSIEDQDRLRRKDTMRMTPAERLLCLINLRNTQFGADAIPLRETTSVSFRRLPFC